DFKTLIAFQQQSPQALSCARGLLFVGPLRVGFQCLRLAGAEGIEPPTSGFGDRRSANWAIPLRPSAFSLSPYSMIFATTPAPTARPPSRIAQRRPRAIALG